MSADVASFETRPRLRADPDEHVAAAAVFVPGQSSNPFWFWTIHSAWLAIVCAPALALLLPVPQALDQLARRSTLAQRCLQGSSSETTLGTADVFIWSWLVGRKWQDIVFEGAMSPTICATAYSDIVSRRLLDVALALGLSAPLCGVGRGIPEVRQRILAAWAAYGCCGAVIEFQACGGGSASWLPQPWPWVRPGLLIAMAVCAVAVALKHHCDGDRGDGAEREKFPAVDVRLHSYAPLPTRSQDDQSL
eukprot:TRINITY_DN52058_c0_g1_i1.p1 TRINITY_DN52058_c0_g1~~TRINITY_DN52058_c0_g1_i1.p1  ORF type:complete len:262 (+),score=22.11 TRINITY_DN52058_c0_g1_i1:41-787(+)